MPAQTTYTFTCKNFVSHDPDVNVVNSFSNHCANCKVVLSEVSFTTLINKADAHLDSVIQEHGYMDNLNDAQYYQDIAICITSP